MRGDSGSGSEPPHSGRVTSYYGDDVPAAAAASEGNKDLGRTYVWRLRRRVHSVASWRRLHRSWGVWPCSRTLAFRSLYFVAFLSSVGFSILLPTLWPRLHAVRLVLAGCAARRNHWPTQAMRRMQDGRTKLFYGIVLSSYCVGQIIGAVVLGSGAARMGYKPVLFASLATELVGYAAYALTPNAWVIMASRLVAGIGAGTCATGCGDSASASTRHGMG